MSKLITLTVGGHFRPPAKQVLAHLPNGSPLELVPEPDNPYDEWAVKVMFDPKHIPESEFQVLDSELFNCGMTLEMLMSEGPIQLGYIPASQGKPLAKAKLTEPELVGNREIREVLSTQSVVTLHFALDGSPRVWVETTATVG